MDSFLQLWNSITKYKIPMINHDKKCEENRNILERLRISV